MFIARQPIFDEGLNVFGYELLFRQGEKSTEFDGRSAQSASASVLLGLYEAGVSHIIEDKMAFINFDQEFIFSDAFELIDSNHIVIEILETVVADQTLVERVKAVKEKGYRIALDDFSEDFNTYPLVPYADIIKFDLMATPLNTIHQEIFEAKKLGKTLLAEKVETQQEYLQAKALGFQLFQGYF
ncbi:MAG: hypothetical protein PWP30_1675, partial [Eubacteriaceae bacterium]|nr:hypothetical protein [Eubacteriaceae bacterium]